MILPLLIGKYTHKWKMVEKEDEEKEDFYKVSVTMYTINEAETDDDPTETASGFRVDSLNPKKHRIIALSHDLKRKIKYGKKVRITGIGKYSGVYVVKDLMNARFRKKVDILINPDDKATSFKRAKLFVL